MLSDSLSYCYAQMISKTNWEWMNECISSIYTLVDNDFTCYRRMDARL